MTNPTSTLWAGSVDSSGPSTPVAWTGTSSATGANDTVNATRVSSVSGEHNFISLTGFAAQTAIGTPPDVVQSVVATIYQHVGSIARFTAVTAQLYDGSTALGSPVALAITGSATHFDVITFKGVANWSNLLNLIVKVDFQHSADTTGGSCFVDAVGIVVNCTSSTPLSTDPLWATTETSGPVNWVGEANAIGPNDGVYAARTAAIDTENEYILPSGYGAQAAMGGSAPLSVDSVKAVVYSHVGTVASWTSATAQLYDGVTPLGTAQSLVLSGSITHFDIVTFTGVTWANLANLVVKVNFVKNTTAGNTLYVDAVSVVVNYTVAGIVAPVHVGAPSAAVALTATATGMNPGGHPVSDTIILAGSAVGSKHVTASAPPFRWMLTGWNIHLLKVQDNAMAQAVLNNRQTFGVGGNPAGSPMQDGFVSIPIYSYGSYAQFAADIAAGNVLTYPWTWVLYDNEKWASTPDTPGASEWADPWTYMNLFTALGHAHGLKVAIAPGRDLGDVGSELVIQKGPAGGGPSGETDDGWFTRTNIAGSAAAGGADMFIVQTEADQTSLSAFASLFNTCYAQVKAANPNCLCFSEVATDINGAYTGAQMLASFQATRPADGCYVSALTIPPADDFFVAWQAATVPPGSTTINVALTATATGGKKVVASATATVALSLSIVERHAASTSVAFSESATGAKKVAGAASASITLATAGAESKRAIGAVTSAVAFATSTAGIPNRVGTATRAVTFADVATGNKRPVVAVSSAIALAGSIAGIAHRAGSVSIPIVFSAHTSDENTGYTNLAFGMSAVSTTKRFGAPTATLVLGDSGAGSKRRVVAVTQNAAFALSSVGRKVRTATPSLSVALALAAPGHRASAVYVSLPLTLGTDSSAQAIRGGAALLPLGLGTFAGGEEDHFGFVSLPLDIEASVIGFKQIVFTAPVFSVPLELDASAIRGMVQAGVLVEEDVTFGMLADTLRQHSGSVVARIHFDSVTYRPVPVGLNITAVIIPMENITAVIIPMENITGSLQ